jgi:hypothetical protein
MRELRGSHLGSSAVERFSLGLIPGSRDTLAGEQEAHCGREGNACSARKTRSQAIRDALHAVPAPRRRRFRRTRLRRSFACSRDAVLLDDEGFRSVSDGDSTRGSRLKADASRSGRKFGWATGRSVRSDREALLDAK